MTNMRLSFVLQESAAWGEEPAAKRPVIEGTGPDSNIESLMSMASLDWYQFRDYAPVDMFRELLQRNEPWSLSLQLVHFSGDEHEVRLAQSEQLAEVGEYGSVSVRQFSAILEDFFRFMEEQVEFERTYER